jgi:hypothetical protein
VPRRPSSHYSQLRSRDLPWIPEARLKVARQRPPDSLQNFLIAPKLEGAYFSAFFALLPRNHPDREFVKHYPKMDKKGFTNASFLI